MSALIPVPFRSATLYIADRDGEPFVPMRPVVEGMGLSWASQTVKLNSDKGRWGVSIIETPMDAQPMLCLPLRKLPGWLMSISPNKVSPEIRDTVIAYQNECDDALWAYWTKGHATNPRSTEPPHHQAFTMAPLAIAAAQAFGFVGNQAVLSANRAITQFTGVNLLEAMGQTALIAPDNQPLLTSSDIALRLGIGKLAANPLLIDCGFQTGHRDHKNRLYYELTEEGQKYGVVLDTGKKNGDGTPVRQIKWSAAVLPILEARHQVESEAA